MSKARGGNPRLLGPSFALMAVGVLVVTFSYTGERIHDITFFYVSILGALIVLGGVVVLAYAKVGAPELTRGGAMPAPAPEEPSAALAPGELLEVVRLCCPDCSHVFEREIVRPATVECPNCSAKADVI